MLNSAALLGALVALASAARQAGGRADYAPLIVAYELVAAGQVQVVAGRLARRVPAHACCSGGCVSSMWPLDTGVFGLHSDMQCCAGLVGGADALQPLHEAILSLCGAQWPAEGTPLLTPVSQLGALPTGCGMTAGVGLPAMADGHHGYCVCAAGSLQQCTCLWSIFFVGWWMGLSSPDHCCCHRVPVPWQDAAPKLTVYDALPSVSLPCIAYIDERPTPPVRNI